MHTHKERLLPCIYDSQSHDTYVSCFVLCITSMNTRARTHMLRYLTQAHSAWQMGAPDDERHQICVSQWEPSLTPFKLREHSGLH